jgi:hypothetical protein
MEPALLRWSSGDFQHLRLKVVDGRQARWSIPPDRRGELFYRYHYAHQPVDARWITANVDQAVALLPFLWPGR